MVRNLGGAPKLLPALIDIHRELLIELCFIVGPVEPDLSTLDVVQRQYLVEVRNAGARLQCQPGPDVPCTIGSRPSHVQTHDHDRTLNDLFRPAPMSPSG